MTKLFHLIMLTLTKKIDCHRKENFYIILLCAIVVTGCIESYPPPIVNEDVSFLVIDGFVNTADGSAEVKLSHAVPLASTESAPPELNATVTLEDNNGTIYPLDETSGGQYTQSNLSLDANKQYRIYIRTVNNTEYRSDFISIKETPPIDSVTWAPSQNQDGIEILVNTHDDSRKTRYYQWTFEETYQYESAFESSLRIENGALVVIPNSERTFVCWRTLPNTKILVGTSDGLNQDVIYNFPVTFIPKGSQKVIIKYSILVKQLALNREAYDYWLNLQKTTENLGSLFDPQPGRVTGNIHNITDPLDPVLGYFSVGSSQEKRLFIDRQEIPSDLRSYKSFGSCPLDSVLFEIDPDAHPDNIVNTISEMNTVIGYVFSIDQCVDCRFQKGTTTKPPFWE